MAETTEAPERPEGLTAEWGAGVAAVNGAAPPRAEAAISTTDTAGARGKHADLVTRLFDARPFLGLVRRINTADGNDYTFLEENRLAGAHSANKPHGAGVIATGEGGSTTVADPSFVAAAGVSLPSRKLAWSASLDHELTEDAAWDTDEWMGSVGMRAGALELLYKIVNGTGGSTEGRGFEHEFGLSANSARSIPAAAADPTVDEIGDLMDHVTTGYLDSESAAFATAQVNLKKLRGLTSGGERFMKSPGPGSPPGVRGYIEGFPVYTLPGMNAIASNAKTVLVFGDWQCFGVRVIGGEVKAKSTRLAGDAWENDLQSWHFSMRYSCGILDFHGLAALNSGA